MEGEGIAAAPAAVSLSPSHDPFSLLQMEGEGIAAAPAAASLSPSHDRDILPIGSPEITDSYVQPPPSDDDHSSGVAVLTDDLRHKIIQQVEYYFSDENLPTDKHMLNLMKKDKEGFVPIAVIASFRKMKKLIKDYSLIAVALRESSLLVVSSNGKKVKRLHPLLLTDVKDPKLCTVLVENLPEDHSTDNIRRIFGEVGIIKNICICDPRAVEESTKSCKAEKLISGKLHALVEYDTVEAAAKAVATLNDDGDWRNGMRVKPLKKMGKYGQGRKAWRGSDSEKNVNARASDHVGDEENHNLSEHHDETPDEEDGEHPLKEKNGQRGQNCGRSRRHKYRGINGLGHGTTSSSHGIETSKPPPGPRMPDGTRGFTMGRGRPPVSNHN